MTNFESALIGCILLEPNQGLYAVKEHKISADSFTDADCRKAFNGIETVAKANRPIDVLTVANTFILPLETLTLDDMMESAATIAYVGHYAEEVKKAEKLRTIDSVLVSTHKQLKNGLTLSDALSRLQSAIIELTDTSGVQVDTLADLKADKIAQWEVAQKEGFVGIPFHLPNVNHALGGLRLKCMSIFAGYRGEGKSTMARDWALQTAKNGIGVALFTLEDPADIAGASIVGNYADISVFGLDTGKCHPDRLGHISQKWDELDGIPLYIISGSLNIDEIDTTARLLKMKYNIGLVIIDHIQYIPPYIMKGMSRNDTVAYYSSRTTSMADQLDVHVCNLSQFSRDGEKQQRKPRLSDLRDSGTLEQDCRAALLLHFDHDKGHHALEIAKNNHGQSGMEFDVKRVDGRQRFEEITDAQTARV